jgi:hypothetical protein
MKKWLICTFCVILFLTILSVLTYEKNEVYTNFTKVEIDHNPYTFKTITNKDSITHVFKIKNTTNTILIIDKVLPSCPCTKVSFDKNKCLKNEVVSITAKFKPTKNQKGDVKTVIFVQCNAEKGIVKLELNGKIKNN